MADSSSESIGSFSEEKLDSKTRDVFQGNALIDRLLVYFSKFEGRREKARKYAQKLLDLGHIESLTQTATFEDSSREYRWTDVASVVNKAKAKAQENGNSSASLNPVISESTPQSSSVARRNEGRPTLRISIEADNCDGAEIQAHIRTNPNHGSITRTHRSTKSGDTVCLAEVKNGKMISFTTETSKTEEVLRMIPVSATPQGREITRDLRDQDQAKVPAKIPDERETSANDATTERKHRAQNTSDVDSAVEVDKTSAEESSLIVKPYAPGKGEASQIQSTFFESKPKKAIELSLSKVPTKVNAENQSMPRQSTHRYKWVNTEQVPCREDSVSAKMPELSKTGNTVTRSDSGSSDLDDKPGTSSSSISPSESEISSPEYPRKMKFKEDSDWIKMRREYLENEEIRQATHGNSGRVELFDDPGISLHSAGYQDTIEEVPEQEDESNEVDETEETDREESLDHVGFPKHTNITVSPPPSTPASPRKSVDSGLKSLFWTKISCNLTNKDEMEGIFWANIEKKIQFDEAEFSRLFSKPPSSPLPKNSRKVIQEENLGSKTLKVLGTERSRQVGIRASSIHLQTEDIHDAIVNMDDSILDVDELEALYDIRPTPDELDDIADALKRNPNAILDKPEQFVLMLAMLNNLDDRLKCWIFLKKFPDKVLDIKGQLTTLSNACIQIVRNPMLQSLLEATLVFGNFLNRGTQRGEADGYYFDILPKLKDVKSLGGESNLMLYLVRWVAAERERKTRFKDLMKREDSAASDSSQGKQDDDDCGLPNQASLQKACVTSFQDMLEDIENISAELNECKHHLIPAVIEGATCLLEIKPFTERMQDFTEQAEKALAELQSLSKEASEIAEEFKRYYVPVDSKSESLTNMLKYMASFCQDFRFFWNEEKRCVAKEAFFNTEKARRQRIAAVKIAKSPSALKARFLEKRRRECTDHANSMTNGNVADSETARTRHNSHAENSPVRSNLGSTEDQDGRKVNGRGVTPVRPQAAVRTRQNGSSRHNVHKGSVKANGHVSSNVSLSAADSNSAQKETSTGTSRLKQAMLKRRMLMKSKTC